MKKLYLILLMLLLLFVPTSINAVAIYQLDQPIKELDNYTLRQVFTNRNMSMPDLTGKEYLGDGWYIVSNPTNRLIIKYNVYTGEIVRFGDTGAGGGFINIFNEPILLEKGTYTFTQFNISNTVRIVIQGEIDYLQFTDNLTYTFDTDVLIFIQKYEQVTSNPYNESFKFQIEKGSIATPYQVPTAGPYNQFDFGWLDLTSEQIQTYYNLYLEAVRFEQENIEASHDNGGYQNIFKAIINGVKNLMVEMGYVWSWLNAPLITSDMTSYSFNIDWSWDLIGVVRQILNSAGILTMQILFIVPSLAFAFMGIPVHVSILSLLFSNLIFLLLGWIMVKSFLI